MVIEEILVVEALALVEGVNTPPPEEVPPTLQDSDMLPPLSRPRKDFPVGGRLAHFQNRWGEITEDSWVLSVVRKGYKIPFVNKPFLSPTPIFLQQTESQALVEEVNKLLLKGAVEKIEPEGLGFYSRIFLVPKKNGKLRLIIDLSRLNMFPDIQSFRIETANKVRQAIQPNDWAFSLDLTDAYLHVPIHRQSRQYLRFCLKGQAYQFKALPFGLATSPYVFTRLMVAIATYLRKRAIVLFPYLDDWLVRNQVHQEILNDQQLTVELIMSLGLIVNEEKSDLVPSELCIHRNGIPNTQEHSLSAIRQSTGHSGTVTVVQETETALSKSLSVSSGKTKCCSSICSIGQATLTSTSNGSVCTMETSCASHRVSHSSQCSCQEVFRMVGQQGTFHLGCNTETVSTNTQSFHGCEPLRIGSPSRTGRTAISWSLDSRPISSSYQCFGDESKIASSKTMSPICLQFNSDDCIGQLFISREGGTHSPSLYMGV